MYLSSTLGAKYILKHDVSVTYKENKAISIHADYYIPSYI